MKPSLVFRLLYLVFTVFLLNACDKTVEQPNIVIVFLDDSGWEDFSPFGAMHIHTPHVDELAAGGTSFERFYVPQAICSASRAALMTGCYPGRTGVFGAHAPGDRGLDTTFATMGEVFRAAGYATAAFGKWHCGDQPDTRSHARGFDETCGLMYSNDMWHRHPEHPEFWGQWPLQFWENGRVVIEEVDHAEQKQLTRWYTEHAVDFIERHADEPFLLYVPHSMPHVPLYTSEDFEGYTGQGLYADVISEIDWSVGEIMKALRQQGVDKKTIFILTSDNGPWISYGDHAGFTPFREAKGTSFDGGIRSACIVRYPGHVPAGRVSEKAWCSIDLLPSLCALCAIPLPKNEIDGYNVWDLICSKEGAVNPHDYYAFSNNRNFDGVMSGDGRWKLHLPHQYRSLDSAGNGGMAGHYIHLQIDTALFDMEADPMEGRNVLRDESEIAESLIRHAEAHKRRFYSKQADH